MSEFGLHLRQHCLGFHPIADVDQTPQTQCLLSERFGKVGDVEHVPKLAVEGPDLHFCFASARRVDSSSSMIEILEADNRVSSPGKLKGFGHPHQVRQRPSIHFSHRRPAMDLDRNLAQAEVARHLLVHLPGGHELHYLLLPR